MIFAEEIACLVNLRVARKWLELHFHGACYVTWEQAADSSDRIKR
jgi:hypothetical protein